MWIVLRHSCIWISTEQKVSPQRRVADARAAGEDGGGADLAAAGGGAPADAGGGGEAAALRARVRELEVEAGLMQRELDAVSEAAQRSDAQLRCVPYPT